METNLFLCQHPHQSALRRSNFVTDELESDVFLSGQHDLHLKLMGHGQLRIKKPEEFAGETPACAGGGGVFDGRMSSRLFGLEDIWADHLEIHQASRWNRLPLEPHRHSLRVVNAADARYLGGTAKASDDFCNFGLRHDAVL